MEVIHFIHGYLVLLATDSVIKSSSSEVIFSKIGSNATLVCPWTEDSVIWYGIYGHQYSSGISILSSLPSSLQARLNIWEKDGYNLRIRNVSRYDEGKYKCSSINGTTSIMMYLMAPPTNVSFQNLVKKYIKGNEGQLMNITCKGFGGHPPPSLLLSKNGNILATSDNGTLVYTFQPSRIDDMSNFTCTANHSELKEPLSVESVLKLNLKTESIRMKSIPTLYEFDVINASCLATGGRPPTSFKWNLLGEYYNSSYEDIENVYPTDTYNVKSFLSLQISRTFHKRKLACIAFDSIEKAGIIRSQTLEIYYPPSIHIIYQNMTVDDNVMQLICQPHGNPIIYKFYQWEHHSTYGEKIRTFDSGLDGSLNILLLERTQRYQDTGIYKCYAENGISDKKGNKIQSGSVFFVNNGKPKVSTINPSNQFCKLGSVGSLVVKYLSWPPPTNFTWFKYEDSRHIKLQASEKYTIIETEAVIIDYFHDRKIHIDGYIGILHINEVSLTDFTNYTVLIQNEYGLEVFTIFFKDTSKYEDSRTNSDTRLFYGGPAVILTVFFTTGVFIVLFLWKKRRTLLSTPSKKRINKMGNEKETQSEADDGSIYSEDYAYPDAAIETTVRRNPSLSLDTDVVPKLPIPFRRTHDNNDVNRMRVPSLVLNYTNDVPRSDDSDCTDTAGPTPPSPYRSPEDNTNAKMPLPALQRPKGFDISFDTECVIRKVYDHLKTSGASSLAADNEGYDPEEEIAGTRQSPSQIHEENKDCNADDRNRRSSLPIHQPYDDYNGIGNDMNIGSQSSSKERGPMSSDPYASYSCNANAASALIQLPTGIRPEKQYYDHYSAPSKVMDSWKEPIMPDKTLDADNEETFKMETDTKEDENCTF